LIGSVDRRVGASLCIGKQDLSSQLPAILRNKDREPEKYPISGIACAA
jgi:hypothetical protein